MSARVAPLRAATGARVALLGTGTVGSAAWARLAAWSGTPFGDRLRLVYAANSRHALHDPAGIPVEVGALLGQKRELLENIAQALLDKETLDEATFTALLDAAMTFNDLRVMLREEHIRPDAMTPGPADQFMPHPAKEGALYPVEGGMSDTIKAYAGNDKVCFTTLSGIATIESAMPLSRRCAEPSAGAYSPRSWLSTRRAVMVCSSSSQT